MTDTPKKKFKAFCMERDLTAKDVSQDTGIPITTIWSYFQGQRNPSSKNMKILADTYGIDVFDMFINK